MPIIKPLKHHFYIEDWEEWDLAEPTCEELKEDWEEKPTIKSNPPNLASKLCIFSKRLKLIFPFLKD